MNIQLIIISLASLILAGCLQTRAELRGEGDKPLHEQTRVYQGQQAAGQAPAQQAPAAPAPPKPLPIPSRLDEIDEQMRQLSGRVDVVENQFAQVNAAETADKDGIQKRNKAIEDKFLAFEDALKKLEAQVQELSQARSEAPAHAQTKGGKDAKSASNPHTDGQALFTAKKWKDAIVMFSKYRDQYPKGKNYADSTYKIGVSFQELGMKEEAKPFLEEVVSKFPGTAEAKKASYRLKSTK